MAIIKHRLFTIAAGLVVIAILTVKQIGPIYLLVPEDFFIVDIIVSALVFTAGFLIDSYLAEIAGLKKADAELRRVNDELAKVNRSLMDYMAQVKVLRGMLPICAICGRIRDDQGEWQETDKYLRGHSEAKVTSSLCPRCMDRMG